MSAGDRAAAGGERGEELVTLQVTRDQLAGLMNLFGGEREDQAREAGRQEAVTGGYQDGWDLGHDTGLAARQDSRAFVAGVLAGWDAGCSDRQQLAEELRLAGGRRAAERRQQRAAEAEAELEAEAG